MNTTTSHRRSRDGKDNRPADKTQGRQATLREKAGRKIPVSLLGFRITSCGPVLVTTSPTARAAWLEILLLYNGSNNGRLAVPGRWLAVGSVSTSPAQRAMRDLVTWGFLDLAHASSFSQKRLAAEYRFTHLPCDKTGELASRTFQNLSRERPGSVPRHRLTIVT